MNTRALRIATLAVAIVLIATAFAQDPAKKVTFQSRAATAKALFPALGQAMGMPLHTAPQTEDEVLLIDVKEVSVDDLMKQIAKVAGAEWKAEGEGFRLIRTQAMHAQQEREYFDSRAARIKSEQDRLLEELAKQKPITAAEARAAAERQKQQQEEFASAIREGRQPAIRGLDQAMQSANPTARLAMRLATILSPGDLARQPAASRVVYSSLPTRAQRPLPAAASRFIGEFVREYQIWLDAQPAPSSEPTGPQIIGPWGNANKMEGGLGKVLVVVSRMMSSSDLQLELLVADGTGAIFARQFRVFQTGSQANRVGQNPEPAAATASEDKPIELSPAAKEHAAFLSQSPSRGGGEVFIASSPAPIGPGGGARTVVASRAVEVSAFSGAVGGGSSGPRLPVSGEWRQKLSQPEKTEPLSFAVSELFQGLAAHRGANLVASLPDSALIPLSSRSQQLFRVGQLLDIAKGSLDMNVEEAGGWLTAMPKFPAYAREIRVDRGELSRLLTGIAKDGRMALDSLARYASSRRNPVPSPGFDGRYVSILHPSSFQEFNQATFNWRTLQLFAQLSVSQRQNLAAEGTISLGMLTPAEGAIVTSMVFDDLAGPIQMQDTRQGPATAEVRSSFVMRDGGSIMSFGGSGGRLSDERTEYLASGIPTNGELSMKVTTQEAVYASKKDGSADPRFFTAEAYGTYIGIAPNLLIAGSNAPAVPQFDTFRPASIQTYDLRIQLTARAFLAKQLRDSWFPPGARDLPYGLLSDDFRAKAEEAAKRMKDTRANISIGGAIGGVRPPA